MGSVLLIIGALLFPFVLLIFIMAMERVERRLTAATMNEDQVSEFFNEARPEEVRTFVKEGWGRALSLFNLRRRPRAARRATPAVTDDD